MKKNEKVGTARCAVRGRAKPTAEPLKDLRTPLAKARDAWLEGEGKQLCEGAPSGIYLRNRIEVAWLAGVVHGQKSTLRIVTGKS